MPELQVEVATLQHVLDISGLVSTSFTGKQSAYTAVGQPGYSNYLEDLLSKKTSGSKFIVVGILQGQVAAYADFLLRHAAPNFLTRIAIKPSFRGRGLAQTFMQKIDETYTNTPTWELDVFHSNVSARKMYNSLGFQIVSSNKWLGRNLPNIPARFVEAQGKTISEDSMYSRYGFTNTSIGGHEVAIAGSAVRLKRYDLFLDTGFLFEVQKSYPTVNRAFFISNDFKELTTPSVPIFEIDRSYRMRGTF